MAFFIEGIAKKGIFETMTEAYIQRQIQTNNITRLQ